jgi:hypothetical protein
LMSATVLGYQITDPGMIFHMSYTKSVILCGLGLVCLSFFTFIPALAFTANSLDITVQENGDALATFRFTLEGLIENAIPQSMLEEELTKGLTTSSEPPELKSMDRSTAVLLLKKFADTSDVPTGTGYLTATMDFKKAEAALQNSGLSGAVSADFSPSTVTLTFPDSYKRQFSNVDVLPAVFHTVEDPVKVARVKAEAEAQAQAQGSSGATATPAPGTATSQKGSISVTSTPPGVKVSIDSKYAGEAPAAFHDIAPGTHVMQFSKEGFSPVTKNVIVNPGKTTSVLIVLTYDASAARAEETSSGSWLPLLVILIGLVVIGIGGYYYWTDLQKKPGKNTNIRNGKGGSAGERKPDAAKIVIRPQVTGPDDTRNGSPAVADAKVPDMAKIVIAPRESAGGDTRDGSTAVADAKVPDMAKIVIAPRESAGGDTRDGSTAGADAKVPDTKKIIIAPRESVRSETRNGKAAGTGTRKQETGKNEIPRPEPENDDTGDECR